MPESDSAEIDCSPPHVDDATQSCHYGGSNERAEKDLPRRIGRYTVTQELGRGGFGIVYLGQDEQLQRAVAIKVPHDKLVSRPEDAEAYLAEARALATLEHPHIVPVYDVGNTDEYPCYIVSKYVDGLSLAKHIKQTRLSHRKTADLIAMLADALHYAHTCGLVHRDVKPGNILLESDGNPFLVDFGLALREQDLGKGSRYAGTPAYMSPEQARGEGHRVDGRSDIYSLGAVLYQLLTGRRTFVAETQAELLEQVASRDPKPPRQINDRVPKELERICLKMLARRAGERYTTALDLADDLRHFVAQDEPSTAGATTNEIAEATAPESTQVRYDSGTTRPLSESRLIRIVPKGLRSFDEHDADFFLELLPGPRDRDGLPDSIRFWKSRVEDTDADRTFSVGLIYGPSGCGKSSLVKAGVLPRLAEHVTSIYVEATADDTETRLLARLRKNCTDLPSGVGLRKALAALRRGEGLPAGTKVLLVLDQFEQWLHAKRDEENTELVQALRQCDGGNVQCIVLVRDDFWMAVTRFFDDLEVGLIKGDNFAGLDLFDARHARRVLTAFGRAYGTLSDNPGQKTDQQKQFIDQAVSGLMEDSKVVCVRLALFAEMVKGKTWTPTTLRDIGGATGIGVAFLDETFSSNAAVPKHRLHQKAARAVLHALLPDSGTDIKGCMRSSDELREVSGYSDRQPKMDELIHILDSELRLITPTDPEGVEADDESTGNIGAEGKYYQLAHDYLVPSLREWLTRKQKETRRGRAELRLSERAALWNVKPENRLLPAWWEYLNIRVLTKRKCWTEPQQMMMRRAGRVLGLRWGSALLVILAIGIAVAQTISFVRLRHLSDRTETAVAAMSTSRGVLVPRAIEDLEDLPRDMVLRELRERFAESPDSRRLSLAYALAHFRDVKVGFLLSQIAYASPDEINNFLSALGHAQPLQSALNELAATADRSEGDWRGKARLAIVALYLEDPSLARAMCQLRPDPIQRTIFIDEFWVWHSDVLRLRQLATATDEPQLRSALCLGIGGISADRLTIEAKQAWAPILTDWFQHHPDKAVHSAAGWALRKWEMAEPLCETPPTDSEWHVNSVGMRMLHIPPGRYTRKAPLEDNIEQQVTISRPFRICDREVSVRQFRLFLDDTECPNDEKPKDWDEHNKSVSRSDQHPIECISSYDAVLFCNWLSRKEGLQPCYQPTGVMRKSRHGRDYETWYVELKANGYRLPTEAEWEYACRAGTATKWTSGNDELLLDEYAVQRVSHSRACGSRLPNGWGLFDMHGNVWEWCQDWYERYPAVATIEDPRGPVEGSVRVHRGGCWMTGTGPTESARRGRLEPEVRYPFRGFRVVAPR